MPYRGPTLGNLLGSLIGRGGRLKASDADPAPIIATDDQPATRHILADPAPSPGISYAFPRATDPPGISTAFPEVKAPARKATAGKPASRKPPPDFSGLLGGRRDR